MTPEEQAAIRNTVQSDPAYATAYQNRDAVTIAMMLSRGRTRPTNTEIGNGLILEVLGIPTGNALLDELHENADYRYVKPLLEQGRLAIGSPMVQAAVQSFAGGILTQAQADALCALGKEPNPYTVQEVAEAIYNVDGSFK